MTLVFATANCHKLDEVRAMMPANIHIAGLDDIDFTDEIPETGTTLEENALLKARYVRERFGCPCFADDTGLEVDALNGAPGVYSARYAGVEGVSQEARSQANVEKLLHRLAGSAVRTARFRTVIAWIDVYGNEDVFEGTVCGTILKEPAGCGGFGYDPVFVPEGYGMTFAEMTPEEKNRISHRARAFHRFIEAVAT